MKVPLICAAITAWLSISATAAQLPEGWAFLREDAGGWRYVGDRLELRSQKGRIWAGDGATNLLLHASKAAGQRVTADVSHTAPKTKYEQGGLLVYRDDDHFVKLINEFIDGEYYVVMAREVGGKGKVFTKIKTGEKGIRLRLAVSGDQVAASYAHLGSDQFKPAGECELPWASDARFGLFTQDGADQELRWVGFENISVSRVKPALLVDMIVDDGAKFYLDAEGKLSPAYHGAFDTRRLSDEFHAEGAAFGDIDRDGANDIVYGPFWFEGPGFETRHQIYKPNRFAIATYSNNFMPYIEDLDGDGWNDVLVIGFPGRAKSTYWYQNPGAQGGDWKKHTVFGGPGNESPAWTDVDGDGRKEIVCSVGGQFVLVRPDWENPTQPWQATPISPAGSTGGHFTHGMGVGDIDGDGKLDLLEKSGWWQQGEAGVLWKKHAYPFSSAGGAQMYAYDFDRDGDNDVITSLAAHGYGLAWFEQVDGGKFVRHLIMGSKPSDSDYGIAFSQLHAIGLADVDGDSIKDVVTGKRFWAHGGKDPGGQDSPVLYWFRTVPGGAPGKVDFVPHLIHGDSGVGTVVTTGQINGDAKLDILIGSKKGCYLHLQNMAAARPLARVIREPRREVEGESMQVLASTGKVRPQPMGNFGTQWSGASQLWWTGGKPGDQLALQLPVGVAGDYRILVALTTAVDYGIVQLSLDGNPLGDPVDCFRAKGVGHTGELDLGRVKLDKGNHVLGVKITGAHPEAVKGYMFGLDYVRLRASAGGEQIPRKSR